MTTPDIASNDAMAAARALNATLRTACGLHDLGIVIPAVAALLSEAMRVSKMPEEAVEFMLANIRKDVLGTDSPSAKFAPTAPPPPKRKFILPTGAA